MQHEPIDVRRVLDETWIADAEYLPTIDSTNNRAADWGRRGGRRLPLLVVADRQTAGRGRGSNKWWTGDGSLAFSLLLELPVELADAQSRALISLAAGTAAVEALQRELDVRHTLGIRWPNDVFAAGKKIVGILIESLADGKCVVGLGINTNNRPSAGPAEISSLAVSLCELTGREHSNTDVLVAVLRHLDERLEMLKDRPDLVADMADRLCLQKNEPLRIRTNNTVAAGICKGIAPDGALLLQTDAGLVRIHSGETVR